VRFFIEPQLPIRVPTATLNPTSLVERSASDPITVSEFISRRFTEPADGCLQLVRDSFVSIKAEDPLVRRLFSGKLFLSRESCPVPVNYPSTMSFSYLSGLVRGTRVNHDNLISPRDRLACLPNILFFVIGDDGCRNFHPIGESGVIQTVSLRAEPNRRRWKYRSLLIQKDGSSRANSQVRKGGFHPSGAAPLGTPGLPPLQRSEPLQSYEDSSSISLKRAKVANATLERGQATLPNLLITVRPLGFSHRP